MCASSSRRLMTVSGLPAHYVGLLRRIPILPASDALRAAEAALVAVDS